MIDSVFDKNRRKINFSASRVREVLPEYFVTDYPNLVTFLEKYYEYLSATERHSFESNINELFYLRDISETSIENLDAIINEIGNGLQVASFFQQPRLMAKLLSSFYASKGSLLSAEGFFRAFFNEDVTVEYPKQQIFIVGESEVGYESQRFIQDAGIYQIFSILIKVGLSVQDYKPLYTRFVHPAGWHFQGFVQTEGAVNITLNASSENPLAEERPIVLLDIVELNTTAGFNELTLLVDSDGTQVRTTTFDTVQKYAEASADTLTTYYESVKEIVSPNSFTFDDDSDGSSRPDTAITLENMDNGMFTRYTSDSAI